MIFFGIVKSSRRNSYEILQKESILAKVGSNKLDWYLIMTKSRCLKITEKVSFNITREASYVYILSGQKFIKSAKKCNFEFAAKKCYQKGHFQ